MKKLVMIATALLFATPAAAATEERIIDVSDVKTVAGILMQAGYKAELKKNKAGQSYIASATNGNEFTVNFYGCKNDTGCDSFELFSWYKKKPFYSLEMVNEWNRDKRFLKIAIDGDGDLVEYIYVSAIGKMTYGNFVDYIEWYASMDSALSKFLNEKEAATTPAKP